MARKIIKDQKDLLDLLSTVQKEPTEGPALPDRLVHHQLQLESLEIENLWSYKRASLRFEPGITVIAGPNGSGKSSLLESIFFALYGSEARHSMGRSLDEIVRIGADSGSVKLSFFYGGKRYHAQVSLRRVAGTIKSERGGCQLTCDDGSVWVGTENVVAEIERLFGMDREGFTNCVYIRQGEIDRLIRADRKDREQMLDGLLGLSKLDLYVTPRSKEALRAINRKLEIIAESLARVRAEIEDLERQGLFAQKSQLTEQLERLHSELAAIDDSRTTAHKLLQSYEEDLRREAQLERELAQLEHELAEKEKRLGQREAERAAAEKELSTISARHQKRLSALKARLHQMGLDSALETLEAAKTSDDVTPLVERIESHRAHLERTRAQLGELREHVAQVRTERAGHERALAHLRQQYSDLERERARVADQIAQLERKLSALTEALTQHEQSVAALLDDLVRRAGELGVALPAQLEAWDLQKTSQIQSAWAQERIRLEAHYTEAQQAILHAKTHYEALRAELAQKEELLRAGRCPTCGQPVPREQLTEALTEITAKLGELEQHLHHEEAELSRLAGKITLWKSVCEALDQFALELERRSTRRAELATQQSALEEARSRGAALAERLAQLERQIAEETKIIQERGAEQQRLEHTVQQLTEALTQALQHDEQLERLKSEIEELLRLREQWRATQEMRKTLVENLNELRGDIARLLERRSALTARMHDRGELERKRQSVQELIASLEEQRAALQAQYDEVVHKRGIVQGQLDHLERLRGELAHLERKQEELAKLKLELDEIVSVYQGTKVELRKRNLEALNYYFNAFFSLMDSGDSYSRVRVRDDYEIEVELKNGRVINPSLMSGGERALINIALRCAIHQVLAKAVRRMPLILDEPTIYLDRDRIHRLQFLLEDLGRRVGQVIVVSHEVGLVEGADHEYRTEKSSENISTIYKVR